MTRIARPVAVLGREICARQDASGQDVVLIRGLGDTHVP
jgi:hypothetical protein